MPGDILPIQTLATNEEPHVIQGWESLCSQSTRWEARRGKTSHCVSFVLTRGEVLWVIVRAEFRGHLGREAHMEAIMPN